MVPDNRNEKNLTLMWLQSANTIFVISIDL